MSEGLASPELQEFSPSERIAEAVWGIEMAVHANLAGHRNTEFITYAFTDRTGMEHGAQFSRTPAVLENSVVYCPTLDIQTRGVSYRYCWVDGEHIDCYPPGQDVPTPADPTMAAAAADAWEWFERRVSLTPELCRIGNPMPQLSGEHPLQDRL